MMYGAISNYSTNNTGWTTAWSIGEPTRVVYYRRDYTYGNEPSRETLRRQLDEFKRLTETTLERKRRISRERNRLHIRSARTFAPPPLVESMFNKPTFVKRACGGRWRVMHP